VAAAILADFAAAAFCFLVAAAFLRFTMVDGEFDGFIRVNESTQRK
jgi:hypothetical protein